MVIHQLVSGGAFALLTLIWSYANGLNLSIKAGLLAMSIWSFYLAFVG